MREKAFQKSHKKAIAKNGKATLMKRLLSVALVLAMVLTIVPLSSVAVRAEEAPAEAEPPVEVEVPAETDAATPTPLTFTAQEAGSTVVFSWKSGSDVKIKASSTEVKVNGANVTGTDWITYTAGDTITLPAGESVSFKGMNVITDNGNYFSMTGKISASGDVTSLTNGVGGDVNLATSYGSDNYSYAYMFMNCNSLTTAPALPSTTLKKYCYHSMFLGCSSLTSAPNLPAETLVENCYQCMFKDCTSLTTAPSLPATTLANLCYESMFSGCTSLTTAPELPATTLANSCYSSMFMGCSSLTTAPSLPATTLTDWCYNNLFYGCTSLTTVPSLPATTLAIECYKWMFMDCTSLKVYTSNENEGYKKAWQIPSGATSATNWNANMFDNTGGSFTGSPEIGTTYYIKSLGKVNVSSAKEATNYGVAGLVNTPNELKAAVLTTEEQALVDSADKTIDIWVEVKDISSTVSAADKTLIAGKLPEGYVVGPYLDVTLWKQQAGGTAEKVTSVPNGSVKFAFTLPTDLQKAGRTYKMIKIHNGVASVLDVTVDASFKETVESNEFSTYAIIYKDAPVATTTDTTSDTNTTSTTASAANNSTKVAAPKTGDANHMLMWIMILVAGMGVVTFAAVKVKKS